MNRRGFLTGMLAAPFVAKAELLMPVQKVVVPEPVTYWMGDGNWYKLGARDELQILVHRMEPDLTPLLKALARQGSLV